MEAVAEITEIGVETTEEPIKWSAKMQQAFAEKEFYVVDMNNFWDV